MGKAANVCYRVTVVFAMPGIKPENYDSSRGNSDNYRVIRNQDMIEVSKFCIAKSRVSDWFILTPL